jgi:anti-sigma factor RsiW
MAEIRDWQIERFVLGELSRAEQQAVARAIAEDPALCARVDAIEASNRDILAAHPPRVAAAVIRERIAARPPAAAAWGRRVAFAATASLAVVGVGLGVLRLREESVDAPAETRLKGLRPHLGLFRQTPAGVEPLAEGALAREGDLVQLTYQAAGRPFGVILSIDGRGAVTVHHPRDGRQAARLVPGQEVRLSSAYRLDDAPGWERFVLVTAEAPFDVAPVVDAAGRLATSGAPATEPLALPSSLEQSSFTLSKDDHR